MEVVAGSIADAADIREGDIIVAINDRIIASIDEIHRLLAILPQSMPLEVTIVRDGSRQLVHIASPGSQG